MVRVLPRIHSEFSIVGEAARARHNQQWAALSGLNAPIVGDRHRVGITDASRALNGVLIRKCHTCAEMQVVDAIVIVPGLTGLTAYSA